MKNNIHFLILFVFLIFGFAVHKLFTFTYITAEFDELRPIRGSLNVYYKGLVVGKAKESKHSSDYRHTLMRLVLYPKNLLLPTNTIVELKKEKRHNKETDFLELIYPEKPSLVMLSNHSKIKGIATVDTETFLKNQHPDDLEEIKENLIQSTQNLSYALQALGEVFDSVNLVLRENQKNIYATTKNIEKTTLKIDKAIDESKLEKTLSNVEETSQNLSLAIKDATGAMPSAKESLEQIQEATCNINAITCGIRRTLSKNFGTMRLLFGKPIQ